MDLPVVMWRKLIRLVELHIQFPLPLLLISQGRKYEWNKYKATEVNPVYVGGEDVLGFPFSADYIPLQRS
jgi:hypothetical protein